MFLDTAGSVVCTLRRLVPLSLSSFMINIVVVYRRASIDGIPIVVVYWRSGRSCRPLSSSGVIIFVCRCESMSSGVIVEYCSYCSAV